MKRTTMKPGRGFAASPEQRKKAHEEPCVVTRAEHYEFEAGGTRGQVDPAHLCPRSQGGCEDPLCVVPLRRDIHRAFDDGEFDLLPYLVGKRVPELCHALEHYDGSLDRLRHRLTGERNG